MYITHLGYRHDLRSAKPEEEKHVHLESPRWASVRKAILELDGQSCYEIFMQKEGARAMWIIGGLRNRYLCQIGSQKGTGRFMKQLVNPRKSSRKLVAIDMYNGPIWTDSDTVPKGMLLKAAKTFAETGELNEELTWT
jgi:hypothetical protein